MTSLLEWLVAEVKAILLWAFEQILDGFLALVNAIPVPDFLVNASQLSLPSEVLYFTTLFQLHIGIGIFVSAYVLRFIIRRLPVVG